MIRRILHAELSDVRALAREAKRAAVRAFHQNFYLDVDRTAGCLILGGSRDIGAGYVLDNPDADVWPDHAHILTIGRVTLAAWGGRAS